MIVHKIKDSKIISIHREESNYVLKENEYKSNVWCKRPHFNGTAIIEQWTQADTDNELAEAKQSKIDQVKAEIIQLAKDTYWDLDNDKTKEQIITIARNRFQTKKDEINALTTLDEINNY